MARALAELALGTCTPRDTSEAKCMARCGAVQEHGAQAERDVGGVRARQVWTRAGGIPKAGREAAGNPRTHVRQAVAPRCRTVAASMCQGRHWGYVFMPC